MAGLKRIQLSPKRIADEIYSQLLAAIGDGDITPNQRLVQERLAAELDVSRTPVREALLRLEQEGVLERAGKAGFVIRSITADEVRDIYQARQAIEGFSVRLLTERADSAALTAIRRTIEREERNVAQTAKAYFNANRSIHRTFVSLAGNAYLLELFDGIWNRGSSFRMFAAIDDVDLARSLGDHDALADAIATGDADHAAASMRAHIVDGLDLQLAAIQP
ncbi:MAG: GntR family transcriptional regulator [Pseudomonadota bacterium]